MAESEVVELEAKSAVDGAWYDCEVTSVYSENASKPKLRIHFVGFADAEDEYLESDCVDDALASLRSRSKPMESEDCESVKAGQIMLTLQKRKGETKYFDAVVFQIKREKHLPEGECSCLFEMKRIASNRVDKKTTMKFSALCILTEKDPKSNPEFAEWLKVCRSTSEPPHTFQGNDDLNPSARCYIPELEPELDHAQLNVHVEELLQKLYPKAIQRLKSNHEWDQWVSGLGLQVKQLLSAKVGSLNWTGKNGVGPGDIVHEAVVVGPTVEIAENLSMEQKFDVFAAQETFTCSCGTILVGELEISAKSPGKSLDRSRMCFSCFVGSRQAFLAATCFRLCHLMPDEVIKVLSLLMKLEKLPRPTIPPIPPIPTIPTIPPILPRISTIPMIPTIPPGTSTLKEDGVPGVSHVSKTTRDEVLATKKRRR